MGLVLFEMNFIEWITFYPGGLSILRRTIKDGVPFPGDLFVFSHEDIGIDPSCVSLINK